ncbi:MAG: rhomboid family intramembrane serine protease, partial [Armatimonadota bacterium]|nr:rhomboid family intramembrane serine protease [Armatimonadota bacterium]
NVPDPQTATEEELDKYINEELSPRARQMLSTQLAYYQADDADGYRRFWQIQHMTDTYVMEPHYSVLNIFAYRAAEPSVFGKLLGLLGSMFLHGDMEHLLGNMLFLWVFGRALEDALGPRVYMISYLLAGIAATLLYHVMTMQFTPQSAAVPLMGASGAIAGVLGFFSIRFYRTPLRIFYILPTAYYLIFIGSAIMIPLGIWLLGPVGIIVGLLAVFAFIWFYGRTWAWGAFKVPSAWAIGGWLVFSNIAPALLTMFRTERAGGVAYWAHIGGFLFGMLYAGLSGSQEEGIKEFMLEDAQKAYADGNMEKAVAYAMRVLRREPNNAAAYEVLAKAYDRQKNEDAALDNYELAILKYLQNGERDHATRLYLEILKNHSLFIMPAASQLALGNHLARGGDYARAAETLVKIPYTFPEAPESEMSLLRSAQLYLEHLNQPHMALQLLQDFMQRYPHSQLMSQAERAWHAAAYQAQQAEQSTTDTSLM